MYALSLYKNVVFVAVPKYFGNARLRKIGTWSGAPACAKPKLKETADKKTNTLAIATGELVDGECTRPVPKYDQAESLIRSVRQSLSIVRTRT